jgi:hypothetical protein
VRKPRYLRHKLAVRLMAGVGGLLATAKLVYAPLGTGATGELSSVSISGLAASDDGSKLVAASLIWASSSQAGGQSPYRASVYLSSDAGTTWKPANAPTNYRQAVASSADGTKLVAASGPSWVVPEFIVSPGRIFTSTDAGATWITTRAPTNTWASVASSADGTKLVAAATTYGGDARTLPLDP